MVGLEGEGDFRLGLQQETRSGVGFVEESDRWEGGDENDEGGLDGGGEEGADGGGGEICCGDGGGRDG